MNIDMLPMKLAFLTHGLLYYNNNNNNVTEKLSKYKDLELEIERMWGVKATTIPVVIGALGLIKKGLEKYIQQITGNIKRRSHYLHRSEERHSNRLLPKRGWSSILPCFWALRIFELYDLVTTFLFFIKSPEEGRLVRPKYRETSHRFCLCSFVIYVSICAWEWARLLCCIMV